MTSICFPTFDRATLISHILASKSLLNPKEKRACHRLENFLQKRTKTRIKVKTYPEKLLRLGLSSVKFELKLYFRLVKSLIRCSDFRLECLVNFYIRACKGIKVKKVPKTVPSNTKVRDAIASFWKKGKKAHALLLIGLFLSGRRSADFKRLRGCDITKLGRASFSCRLQRDKKHNHAVDFILNFDAYEKNWCFLNKNTAIKEFNTLRRSASPFSPVCLASFARDANLHPHALRSVRSIKLIQEGKSDDQVCEYIGWDDTRSLRLYTRLPRAILRALPWKTLVNRLNEVDV